eukprot:CAMPEP_0114235116 /NCGR_PEP_ID=MMETSP0058-20121206/6072_1 /TAXON_ID=36894 /ORGANISM="Pyramimonas parkeae, CCMP726" /LENGTH=122 /DNA_ID=CAMNT_0001346843 /DNA_START=308 /DNA_END=676 /DNA_ORIENTATION=+
MALLKASHQWGEGLEGSEQIAYPVCKRKYQPFTKGDSSSDPAPMFACFLHNSQRESRVKRFGPHPCWQRFDAWDRPKLTQANSEKPVSKPRTRCINETTGHKHSTSFKDKDVRKPRKKTPKL